jgi:hypothetical protein
MIGLGVPLWDESVFPRPAPPHCAGRRWWTDQGGSGPAFCGGPVDGQTGPRPARGARPRPPPHLARAPRVHSSEPLRGGPRAGRPVGRCDLARTRGGLGAHPRHSGAPLGDRAAHSALETDPPKKTRPAAERDAALRATFRLALARNLDPTDLVSVDESSTPLALTRLGARAPPGARAVGSVPRHHGTPTTLLPALNPQGVPAALTLPGAVDQLAFRVFVRAIWGPTLRPQQVVLTDHRTVHHAPNGRALVEARAGQLIDLPASSPDLAPVELAIAKIKAHLRQVAARTQHALDQASTAALNLITPEDAQGFFRHAGYFLPVQT